MKNKKRSTVRENIQGAGISQLNNKPKTGAIGDGSDIKDLPIDRTSYDDDDILLIKVGVYLILIYYI